MTRRRNLKQNRCKREQCTTVAWNCEDSLEAVQPFPRIYNETINCRRVSWRASWYTLYYEEKNSAGRSKDNKPQALWFDKAVKEWDKTANEATVSARTVVRSEAGEYVEIEHKDTYIHMCANACACMRTRRQRIACLIRSFRSLCDLFTRTLNAFSSVV